MLEGVHFADIDDMMARFPDSAETLIVDAYLSDQPHASIRLFRLYGELPAHHHTSCDELLFLLRGSVEFTLGAEPPRLLRAGQLVIFPRGAVHRVVPAGDDPAIFLTADTPRRMPADVHFADPGSVGRAFVSHLPGFGPAGV
jgi:quercetin dioxygenase-like cupin family protein